MNNLKIIGRRKQRILTITPNSKAFAEALAFNNTMIESMPVKRIFIKKGVYAFKTHEEANQQWEEGLIKRMQYLREKNCG